MFSIPLKTSPFIANSDWKYKLLRETDYVEVIETAADHFRIPEVDVNFVSSCGVDQGNQSNPQFTAQ